MAFDEKFIITNPKYKEGILIDEYNGNISLVLAQAGKDGKIYKRWAFSQVYDKETMQNKASDKALPIKLPLGESADEAIERLLELARELGWVERKGGDDGSIPF